MQASQWRHRSRGSSAISAVWCRPPARVQPHRPCVRAPPWHTRWPAAALMQPPRRMAQTLLLRTPGCGMSTAAQKRAGAPFFPLSHEVPTGWSGRVRVHRACCQDCRRYTCGGVALLHRDSAWHRCGEPHAGHLHTDLPRRCVAGPHNRAS